MPFGYLGAVRTLDRQIRNLLLYPTELRDRRCFSRCKITNFDPICKLSARKTRVSGGRPQPSATENGRKRSDAFAGSRRPPKTAVDPHESDSPPKRLCGNPNALRAVRRRP